jgi:hypothetical protein
MHGDVPRMTEREWMAIADALYGLPVSASHRSIASGLSRRLVEADAASGIGAKWGVNARALAERLQAASMEEALNLVRIVRDLWKNPAGDWSVAFYDHGVRFEREPQREVRPTAFPTDEQISMLFDLMHADRREEFDSLCESLGVLNPAALWAEPRQCGRPSKVP